MASRSSAGLCAECAWMREVVSARGSTFLRCGRSDLDARFRKYPALPVRSCPGFEAAQPGEPRDTGIDDTGA